MLETNALVEIDGELYRVLSMSKDGSFKLIPVEDIKQAHRLAVEEMDQMEIYNRSKQLGFFEKSAKMAEFDMWMTTELNPKFRKGLQDECLSFEEWREANGNSVW